MACHPLPWFWCKAAPRWKDDGPSDPWQRRSAPRRRRRPGPVRSGRGGRRAPPDEKRADGQEDDERVSTTLEDLEPVPVELGGVRGGPDVRTLRRDPWWRTPAATVAFLTVIVVYATWAVFQNAHYYVGAAAHRDLISPLYSPCITGAVCPVRAGASPSNWWRISPGLLALTSRAGSGSPATTTARPTTGASGSPRRHARWPTATPATPARPASRSSSRTSTATSSCWRWSST